MSQITISNFTYGVADLGVVNQMGIPKVKLHEPLTFYNADSAADIYHSVTACKAPCDGVTGLDYPLANAGPGPMNFDSMDIGWGLFFTPAKGQFGSQNKTWDQAVRDGAYWTFKPTKTGVYTFFCRIHPFMRGVIKVVK